MPKDREQNRQLRKSRESSRKARPESKERLEMEEAPPEDHHGGRLPNEPPECLDQSTNHREILHGMERTDEGTDESVDGQTEGTAAPGPVKRSRLPCGDQGNNVRFITKKPIDFCGHLDGIAQNQLGPAAQPRKQHRVPPLHLPVAEQGNMRAHDFGIGAIRTVIKMNLLAAGRHAQRIPAHETVRDHRGDPFVHGPLRGCADDPSQESLGERAARLVG